MAFDIENPLGTGTDAELLQFTRAAIARITLHGTARGDNGQTLTFAHLDELWKQVRILEARIAAAATASASKSNYARLNRPL